MASKGLGVASRRRVRDDQERPSWPQRANKQGMPSSEALRAPLGLVVLILGHRDGRDGLRMNPAAVGIGAKPAGRPPVTLYASNYQ
jgi:hypothetical protein